MWYDWISDRIGLNSLLFGQGGVLPAWLGSLEILLAAAAGYLLGSVNSAIIVSKKLCGKDVRGLGSGNAGLTNVLRVFGKKAAAFTLLGDVLKSALSVVVGALLCGGNALRSMEGAYLAGLFCVIGHIAPVYYRFRGGKGVLAAATMILLLDPVIFLMLIVIFALVLLLTRYVSMASVVAAFFYPALTYITHRYITHTPPGVFKILFAFVCGLLVIYMHRDNLRRIYDGKENKLSFGPKKKSVSKGGNLSEDADDDDKDEDDEDENNEDEDDENNGGEN